MDLGVERHEPYPPVDWAVGGSWEDGLDQTMRVFLALLKILHFILLATGCYGWFLRKEAARSSLWFREHLHLEQRTQRGSRLRVGSMRSWRHQAAVEVPGGTG